METDMTMELLKQLRDVHLPEPVSWWPPAPGWWLVALITLLVLIWIVKTIVKRRRDNQYRLSAIKSLQHAEQQWQSHQQPVTYLRDASEILRRVAIHLSGRERVSRLTHDAWLTLLDSMTVTPLSELSRNGLTVDVYRAEPTVDVPAVHSELLSWLRRHRIVPEVRANG